MEPGILFKSLREFGFSLYFEIAIFYYLKIKILNEMTITSEEKGKESIWF